jgi:hypothetical protein
LTSTYAILLNIKFVSGIGFVKGNLLLFCLVVSSCDWIGEVEEGDQNDLDKYVIKH